MKHIGVNGLWLLALLAAPPLWAQAPAEMARQTEADHQQMMQQLGITQLRKGPSGDEKAPDHANYDDALANPYPVWPDPLRLNDGGKVTTPARRVTLERNCEAVATRSLELSTRLESNCRRISAVAASSSVCTCSRVSTKKR